MKILFIYPRSGWGMRTLLRELGVEHHYYYQKGSAPVQVMTERQYEEANKKKIDEKYVVIHLTGKGVTPTLLKGGVS